MATDALAATISRQLANGHVTEFTPEEVAKHNTKDDIWVMVNGNVINVTAFLCEHPGGELVLLTFAGKDATSEFNQIHPSYLLETWVKAASFKVMGKVKQAKAEPEAVQKAASVKEEADWGYIGALLYLAKGFLKQILLTFFSAFSIDTRVALTRTASMAGLFIVLHGLGNLQSFLGPDAFNGYGHMMVRIAWTGVILPINIMEEYFCAGLFFHACIGVKRTWDKRRIAKKMFFMQACSQFRMGISGVMLGCFLAMHLSQFRFAVTQEYYMRLPPYLVNPTLNPAKIWMSDDTSIVAVPVRDIYKLEYEVFNKDYKVWGFVYMFFVATFVTHGCWGWTRLTNNLDIPKQHFARVHRMGWALITTMGLMYGSFALFAMFSEPAASYTPELQPLYPKNLPVEPFWSR